MLVIKYDPDDKSIDPVRDGAVPEMAAFLAEQYLQIKASNTNPDVDVRHEITVNQELMATQFRVLVKQGVLSHTDFVLIYPHESGYGEAIYVDKDGCVMGQVVYNSLWEQQLNTLLGW